MQIILHLFIVDSIRTPPLNELVLGIGPKDSALLQLDMALYRLPIADGSHRYSQ